MAPPASKSRSTTRSESSSVRPSERAKQCVEDTVSALYDCWNPFHEGVEIQGQRDTYVVEKKLGKGAYGERGGRADVEQFRLRLQSVQRD